MAAIVLMALLVPVVVWIAVRLESSLDGWDNSAAAVPEQLSSGESEEIPAPLQSHFENLPSEGLEPDIAQSPPGTGKFRHQTKPE